MPGNKRFKAGTEGPITREMRMKYEIAEEIGLSRKVLERGWAGLSPAESGRVGGLMRARLAKERARHDITGTCEDGAEPSATR